MPFGDAIPAALNIQGGSRPFKPGIRPRVPPDVPAIDAPRIRRRIRPSFPLQPTRRLREPDQSRGSCDNAMDATPSELPPMARRW